MSTAVFKRHGAWAWPCRTASVCDQLTLASLLEISKKWPLGVFCNDVQPADAVKSRVKVLQSFWLDSSERTYITPEAYADGAPFIRKITVMLQKRKSYQNKHFFLWFCITQRSSGKIKNANKTTMNSNFETNIHITSMQLALKNFALTNCVELATFILFHFIITPLVTKKNNELYESEQKLIIWLKKVYSAKFMSLPVWWASHKFLLSTCDH